MRYTPSLAFLGTANWLAALRPPVGVSRQFSSCVYSCPLPTWVMVSVRGMLLAGGSASVPFSGLTDWRR